MTHIPSATVSRLVTYLRILTELNERGVERAASDDLARDAHVSAFQVRKDLAYFGRFGTRGAGYVVVHLLEELQRILGLTRTWNAAIVGMGRLGGALADYPNMHAYGFSLRAAFDNDPAKVGTCIGGLTVHPMHVLTSVARREALDIALLTVPGDAAQAATEALAAAGVRGILNFAPIVLDVPDGMHVESADFLAGLTRVSYYLHASLTDPDGAGVAS